MIGSAVILGTVAAAPLAAHAVPRFDQPASAAPTTSAQVTAKLHELAISSEKLSEQLNQARIDVADARQQAARAAHAAAVARDELREAKRQLAISLASQYKSASFSRTVALLSSNSGENYLQTVQSMDLLTEHQGQVATIATNAIATATKADSAAKTAVDQATATQSELVARQSALTAQVTKYKTLLATLTAAERAKYYTPRPAPAQTTINKVFAAATVVAPKAATPQATAAPSVTTPAATTGVGAGAAQAIATARAQLGKPYAWGASGPDSFDCSGLVAYAWGSAGVSLPHNAAAQQGMGTAVDQADLAPGDLVFFGSPAYHVGIYIGDGLMIHAPTTGDVVKIVSLSYMSDYSGARRIG